MAETVAAALRRATAALQAVGCATPALDARLLLQAATGLSYVDVIAEPDHCADTAAMARFADMLARREGHEPVSKILGVREFFGRPFHVNADVLDPRPDTETLVEAALGHAAGATRLLDLGSGSGAIVVSLLAELPQAKAVAVDVSAAARAMTQRNAVQLGVAERLTVVDGPWFHHMAGVFDLIVSNPPYIIAAEIAVLSPDVRQFDPHLALDGGGDGLTCYRDIAAGVGPHLAPGGLLLLEIGIGQADDVAAIFGAAGFAAPTLFYDLAGHVRVLGFLKPVE